jgi:N-acetylneuraminic acid mutarotase
MKNLTASARVILASFVFLSLFNSCKKTNDIIVADVGITVLSTSPDDNATGSRYDGEITATLTRNIDTTRFLVSISVAKGDSLINGDITIVKDIVSFIPETELLPSTSYIAAVSVFEKEKPTYPVYTYQWTFETKVEDAYEMTLRSNQVTDFVRDGTRSMQIGNHLYSFGGWHVPEESFNDIYRSSGDLSEWEKLPNAPWHGRHVYGIAKIEDSTYIIGGDNLQSLFDVWRTTDGENWTLLAQNILGNRIFYGCTVHNGYIYVVGGLGYYDVWRSRNGIYWEQVTNEVPFLKGECFAGSLASFNGKMWMLCGGNNGFGQGSIRKEVWSSTDGKIWKQEKDFSGSKRYYTDVIVWDNKLWVVGGFNYEEGNIKSIWYMKSDGTWKEFETPVDYIGRHATGVAVYNNQLVITCGNYQNNCWVIQKVR